MAQVWRSPADTATAVRPVPRFIGVDEGALVCVLLPPSPNCPYWSRPQHFISPLSRMTQVWNSPTETATAVRPVPRSIAVDEGAVVSVLLPPSPNCPWLSRPQHFASPLSRMAQVWYVPADIATAVRPVPRLIAVDEGALVSELVPPSPNCPLMSYPQHFRSPLSRMAQVWYPPADTATAVRPVPRSIAVDEGALVSVLLPPSPNCP